MNKPFPHRLRIKPGLLNYELQYKHPDGSNEYLVHSVYTSHEGAKDAKKSLKQTHEYSQDKDHKHSGYLNLGHKEASKNKE